MKKIMLLAAGFMFSVAAIAQDGAQSAKPGTIYGTVGEKGDIIKVVELESNLKENKYAGKVSGKVAEVCQTAGCWIKLELTDGKTLMVKAKDHSFFMPPDIVGKNVVVDGEATVKEVSESMRRHYAEDAGKSADEIKKIKGSSKELIIAANGVKVL